MSQTVVTIDVGGTGANTAAGALISLGAAPAISFDQSNTAVVTANIANAQATTANTQANFARAQANAAFNAANNRVLKAGDTMTGNLNVAATLITQNVIPDANITYDLGSSEARFKDLWLSNSTIHLGEATISSNGSKLVVPAMETTTGMNLEAEIVSVSNSANNRVLKAGDTMTGLLNVANNLVVTGNVGINTASPSVQLHLRGSDREALRLETTGNVSSGGFVFQRFNDVNGSAAYIGFGGTADVFDINSYKSGSIRFATADSERMRIAANGFVAIGTTAPSTKLHLYESGAADAIFRITPQNASYDPVIQMVGQGNNIADEGFEIWYDNSVGDVHLGTTFDNAAASIRFHTRTGASKSTSNERLTILGNGYVGISTSNPQQPFVLVDGTGRGIEMGPSQGVDSGAFLQAYTRSPASYNPFTYYASSHTWYAGSVLSRVIDLTSSGLGIGTSSPGSRVTLGPSFATIIGLTIDTENSQDSAFVARKAANKPAFGLLPWDGQVYLSVGIYYDGGDWVQHCNTNDNLLFVLDPGDGVRWYASDNGSGTWNVASNIQLWNPAGQWTAAVNTSTSKVIAGNGWQYGNLQLTGFLSGYSDNQHPTLKTSGDCIYFDANGTYTGYICFNGGFTDVSDERQKKNIRSINNALDILTNLRGVRFNWKDDRDDGLDHAGFIAQEVQQYLPEAVNESGTGMLGVQSPAIIAVLVQAVKEQQVLIENMQTEINALKGSQ
jgi:hypothetical protein